jgi:hypothetical protein
MRVPFLQKYLVHKRVEIPLPGLVDAVREGILLVAASIKLDETRDLIHITRFMGHYYRVYCGKPAKSIRQKVKIVWVG